MARPLPLTVMWTATRPQAATNRSHVRDEQVRMTCRHERLATCPRSRVRDLRPRPSNSKRQAPARRICPSGCPCATRIRGMLNARTTAERWNEKGEKGARVTRSPEGNGATCETEPGTPPALRALCQRIEGEYREMPGLSLTLPQAERLWGLDRPTCEFALATLIRRRVLRRGMNGTYVCRSSE
jgi:hypothetical protein